MPLKYETIIFDLDGTILDSAPGIRAGLAYALEKLGRPFPADLDLRLCMGPPLSWSFTALLGLPESRADEAVDIYREYYGQSGLYQAEIYPGLLDLLRDLNEAGAAVCLATSKSEIMARRMLEHFGLTPFLREAVMASGRERLSAKKQMIEEVLSRRGPKAGRAVMIGDTFYDAEGAGGAGVDFIGVLYGYGRREEMEAQGGRIFASDAAALRALLIG